MSLRSAVTTCSLFLYLNITLTKKGLTMDFQYYLLEQLKMHPSMLPQDIIKLCYQAAFGAEHLLTDTNRALKYLEYEYANVSPSCGELYEMISDEVCRINLSVWKYKKLPLSWLFKMFADSAHISSDGAVQLESYMNSAEALLQNAKTSFSFDDWKSFRTHYEELGMPAIHHSESYRNTQKPSYRIVNSRFLRLIPILQYINNHETDESRPFIIAIDGRAASGKSTMASQLRTILDAPIIHMDDFFLPLSLRTPKRFAAFGGNVHYERFKAEVLPFISLCAPFSYNIFDCTKMELNGTRQIASSQFRIVEGSYSHHPSFGSYADLKVFSDIDATTQLSRIILRNSPAMTERFKNEWIPLEEAYFSHCQTAQKADILV